MTRLPMLFADGIDIPMVLIFGLTVLTPLMLFQVAVESAVLARVWEIRFLDLTRFVFRANIASLIAGIPTKILNMAFYGLVLPWDNLPIFFRRYPWAVGVGTLLYFVVTVLVESWRAFVWNREGQLNLTSRDVWRGMLLANLATYLVLAPAHYFLTRPITDVRDFTEGASWAAEPHTQILMFEPESSHLKVCRVDGGATEILVPDAVKDYLVSADLRTLLYRGTNGTVQLVRRDVGRTNTILDVNGGTLGTWTAFAPDGERVASVIGQLLFIFDARTEKRSTIPLPQELTNASIAWTTNRDFLVFADALGRKWLGELAKFSSLTLSNALTAKFAITNQVPALLECFVMPARSFLDECGDLKVMTFFGLSSSLRIYGSQKPKERLLTLSVNPGVMHLSSAQIRSARFLADCRECVFEASDAIYLLDIAGRRAGRLASGTRPLPMTKRFLHQTETNVRKIGR